MSIRVGNHRSAVFAAASLAALIGLTSCGASAEPAGQVASTGSAMSPAPSSEPASTSSTAPSSSAAPTTTPEPTESTDSTTAAAGEPDVDDNDPALCDAADLSGSVEDVPGGATAGSVYRGLTLTNTSDESCILRGYPGVSYVERGTSTPIGAPAVRSDTAEVLSIDLAPGDTAIATLKQTNAQNYGDQCEQVQADGLMVFPPSAYDSLFIEQDIPACANEAIELMSVEAFRPVQ